MVMLFFYSEILIIFLDFFFCLFNNKIIVDLLKDIKIRYVVWGWFFIYWVLGIYVISCVCLYDNMLLIFMWLLINRKWNICKFFFWLMNIFDILVRIGFDCKYILIIY